MQDDNGAIGGDALEGDGGTPPRQPSSRLSFSDEIQEVVRRPGAEILDDEEGTSEGADRAVDAALHSAADLGAGDLGDDQERSGVVSARGTAEGLVLRVDGRVDAAGLRSAVSSFVKARKAFLAGQEISIEWVGQRPAEEITLEIQSLLKDEFEINVRTSRLREYDARAHESSTTGAPGRDASSREANPREGRKGLSASIEKVRSIEERRGGMSLFDGIDSLTGSEGSSRSSRPKTRFEGDPTIWDEPDSRVIYGTLRSGQKIETEHSLIICGDVNSGAEVVAGGDVVVLGTLRGVAHAGAYDETGGGRFIFALSLQPTQLRIGTVISRGAPGGTAGAEIARVDGTLIVVEPYQPRAFSARRL